MAKHAVQKQMMIAAVQQKIVVEVEVSQSLTIPNEDDQTQEDQTVKEDARINEVNEAEIEMKEAAGKGENEERIE